MGKILQAMFLLFTMFSFMAPTSGGTETEPREKYYDYALANPQLSVLMNRSVEEKEITDEDMTCFVLILTKDINGVSGGTIDEFNEITDKYFNKRIEDFNNTYAYLDPATGLVNSTGWGYSTAYLVLKDLTTNADGIKTAEFYLLIRQPGDEWPGENEAKVKEDLLAGNFDGYGPVYPAHMEFIEKYDENGDMYFQIISAYQEASAIGDVPAHAEESGAANVYK